MFNDMKEALLWCCIIASLGGAAKHIADRVKGQPFDWVDFFGSILMSGLLGLIVCMAAHAYGLTYEWCGALSGMSGLLGKELVKLTLAVLRNKTGVEK